MGLDTKMRIYDERPDGTFLQPGVDHGGRIKRVFKAGEYEIWRFPGHRYCFGLGLYEYARTEYRLVRFYGQEFHFMGERRPSRELAGDTLASVEPGRKWKKAVRMMEAAAAALAYGAAMKYPGAPAIGGDDMVINFIRHELAKYNAEEVDAES